MIKALVLLLSSHEPLAARGGLRVGGKVNYLQLSERSLQTQSQGPVAFRTVSERIMADSHYAAKSFMAEKSFFLLS